MLAQELKDRVNALRLERGRGTFYYENNFIFDFVNDRSYPTTIRTRDENGFTFGFNYTDGKLWVGYMDRNGVGEVKCKRR